MIVGVAKDGKYGSLTEEAEPHFYLPFAQAYEADMVLVARTSGDPAGLLPLLSREARAIDPELPVEASTMEEHLGYALLAQRVGAAVLGIFGLVAALLAAFGLYGVMSYVVSQRTAEIGIRMALGARAKDVRMLVVRRALSLTAVGVGLGLAGAVAATRLLASFLVNVSPTDPVTFSRSSRSSPAWRCWRAGFRPVAPRPSSRCARCGANDMTSSLAADIRLALRRLRRSPGFTAAAVATLALGIGANSAFFSLADAALLRPLPYPSSDRLVMLWERQATAGKERERVSAANFLDWRLGATSLDAIALWVPWGLALTGEGEPEELSVVRMSPAMFQVLGVAPASGRGFLPEEETPGRDRVVVLSHGFWVGRMGADPKAVGRTLTLDGEPFEIVGVMPEGFRFPDDATVALWTPLAIGSADLVSRAERRYHVIGRLRDGASASRTPPPSSTWWRAGSTPSTLKPTRAGPSVWSGAADAVAAGGRPALGLLIGTVALCCCSRAPTWVISSSRAPSTAAASSPSGRRWAARPAG